MIQNQELLREGILVIYKLIELSEQTLGRIVKFLTNSETNYSNLMDEVIDANINLLAKSLSRLENISSEVIEDALNCAIWETTQNIYDKEYNYDIDVCIECINNIINNNEL